MKDTIKARQGGYSLVKVVNVLTGEDAGYRIDDGPYPLFVAEMRTWEDYEDEKRQNECFCRCEIFSTTDGNQYIYWRDNEINADYITQVPKELIK